MMLIGTETKDLGWKATLAGGMVFSYVGRREAFDRLVDELWDLLVIGGGIVGAGIARDAALRGFRTALVEKADFASGTSSKSTRLIHGGLRYLEQLEFGLVFDACRERWLLLQKAPHLVRPLPFVFSVYRNSSRPLWQVEIGMWLYHALATFRNIERPRIWRGPQRVRREEPLISQEGLVGGARYYDACTDDARFTLSTIIDAHEAGAALANYTEVTGLLKKGGRAVGVQICDRLTGAEAEIRSRVVVSAAGPWTDQVLQLGDPSAFPCLSHTKGVHIVVPRHSVPSRAAIAFTSPRDDRLMFLVPWGDFSILGTTDTYYLGPPEEVYATADEVAYILEAANHAFPTAKLMEEDIVSTYAGLRPLIRQGSVETPSRMSREHQIFEPLRSFVAIVGGKLTTYRSMAQELVDYVQKELSREHDVRPLHPCATAQRPLPGGNVDDWETYLADQLSEAPGQLEEKRLRHLIETYGTAYPSVLELIREDPGLAAPIVPGRPECRAQVVYAVRQEMAMTLSDVLIRRTHIMDEAPDQGLEMAGEIAALMARELGWDEEEQAAQVEQYCHEVELTRRWRSD